MVQPVFRAGCPTGLPMVKQINPRTVRVQFCVTAVDGRLRLRQSYLTPHDFLNESHDPGMRGLGKESRICLNHVIEIKTPPARGTGGNRCEFDSLRSCHRFPRCFGDPPFAQWAIGIAPLSHVRPICKADRRRAVVSSLPASSRLYAAGLYWLRGSWQSTAGG